MRPEWLELSNPESEIAGNQPLFFLGPAINNSTFIVSAFCINPSP